MQTHDKGITTCCVRNDPHIAAAPAIKLALDISSESRYCIAY
jgi:hypothetical protein